MRSEFLTNVLLIAGLILLSVPVFLVTRWIMISTDPVINHPDAVAKFLVIFPPELQSQAILSQVGLVFSGVALLLVVVGVARVSPKQKTKRLFSMLVMGISVLLTFAFIWAQM